MRDATANDLPCTPPTVRVVVVDVVDDVVDALETPAGSAPRSSYRIASRVAFEGKRVALHRGECVHPFVCRKEGTQRSAAQPEIRESEDATDDGFVSHGADAEEECERWFQRWSEVDGG